MDRFVVLKLSIILPVFMMILLLFMQLKKEKVA